LHLFSLDALADSHGFFAGSAKFTEVAGLRGHVSHTPWFNVITNLPSVHSLFRLLMILNNMCLSTNPWHTLPLLIQENMQWDFTMVTQDTIQSLVRQTEIFLMTLPVAQWLGSLDMI